MSDRDPDDLRVGASAPGDDEILEGETLDVGLQAGFERHAGRAGAGPPPPPGSASLVRGPAARLGPYEILSELGRGGQGIVYLAWDARLGRRVALKVLSTLGPGSEETMLRFQREAAVASRLEHPGICGVHDAGIAGGVPYIAMQLIEGETLERWLQRARSARTGSTRGRTSPPAGSSPCGPAPDAVAAAPAAASSSPSTSITRREVAWLVETFEAIARALHAAHEAGITHRDLKPGNIMITADGRPVILDFGLARDETADQATLTRTRDVLGTPAYMSPEQVAGSLVRSDRRTDVYSLGVTLFECVTLRRPFEGPTREALYRAILAEEPPPVRRLNSAVTRDLAVVMATAMEKDRDRRYQTALDLADDLRRAGAREPIAARPARPWTRLVRWSQRHPGVAASLALAFVFLGAGIAVSLRLRARAEANARTALRALADWERLADGRRLDDLVRRADRDLWPAVPDKVAAMVRWLEDARAVAARLPDHRQALAELRRRATAYSPAQRELDQAAGRAELAAIVESERVGQAEAARDLADLDDEMARVTGEEVPARRLRLKHHRRQIEEIAAQRAEEQRRRRTAIERALGERRTWEFEHPRDQLQHDKLEELIAGLERLTGDALRTPVTLAGIEARAAFAAALRKRTVDDHAAAWQAAVHAIAGSPRYGGLIIGPQVGLIPLGEDRDSGLWEFAEIETGEPPRRSADGKLAITEASGMVFVLVPGGTFRMGAQSSDRVAGNHDPLARPNEGPVAEVTLDPFFLSKYEMTQGQWLRFTGRNPSQYSVGWRVGEKLCGLLCPVEQVSWEDCATTLGRLGLVLPTEAQWEYAARGGTRTPWWCDPGELAASANLVDAYYRANGGPADWKYEAWDDGYGIHAPVGAFQANPFGLHDVVGNLSEWCRDAYAEYQGPVDPGDGARPARHKNIRVYRGGAFDCLASDARSARRMRDAPGYRVYNLGVRPARLLTPKRP